MPKCVVRLDVEAFYESIPHDKLLGALKRNPDLGTGVKRHIAEILRQYAALTSQPPDAAVGIPRGIGISSYLAEAFMSSFDRLVSSDQRLVFYSRYVDDIVAVFATPNSGPSKAEEHRDQIIDLLHQHGLRENANTEKNFAERMLASQPKSCVLTFLGYEITYSLDDLQVVLSKGRRLKLVKRISAAFDAYHRSKSKSRRASLHLLMRVRFLTGNTRLQNNKAGAFVGVYYSNKFLSHRDQLKQLDYYIRAQARAVTDPGLRRKLLLNSLEMGHKEKTFHHYTFRELEEISSVWRRHD